MIWELEVESRVRQSPDWRFGRRRSGEWRSRDRRPELLNRTSACSPAEYLLNLSGQVEIIFRQASGAMGAQIHGHFVPGIRPVRMMIHLLSRQRDPRHEAERVREILEFKHAVQVSVQHAPAAKFPQLLRNLLFRQFYRGHENLPFRATRSTAPL